MCVVLFEDEHIFAANVQRGLAELARQRNLSVVVRRASKDWWEFIEGLIHVNEEPKAPAERAIDQPSISTIKMVWIIDLGLGKEILEAGRTKLNEYLDARMAVDHVLAQLAHKVRNTHKDWSLLKPGVAIAAYASQHGVRFRFLSKYASWGDPHLRALLSYLLTGTRDPLPLKAVNFDKGELGIPRPGAPMSDREQNVYKRMLDWIEEGDAAHKKNDRIQSDDTPSVVPQRLMVGAEPPAELHGRSPRVLGARDVTPQANRDELNRSRVFAAIAHWTFVTGILIAVIGIVLIVAGGPEGQTVFSLFGQEFRSGNVGIAAIFIGAVMIVLNIRRLLKSVDRLIDRVRDLRQTTKCVSAGSSGAFNPQPPQHPTCGSARAVSQRLYPFRNSLSPTPLAPQAAGWADLPE